MRKLGLIIITLFIALPIALCGLAASAADLPSAASGTYAGSGATAGWQCELRAYQISDGLGGTMRALSADCDTPAGHRGGAIATSDVCPSERTQPPLPRFGDACGPAPFYCTPPGTPKLSVLSYAPSTAQCALGEIRVQITSAVAPSTLPGTPGPESVMCRTQIVVPVASYPGCGADVPKPAPVAPRSCRRFGQFCGH